MSIDIAKWFAPHVPDTDDEEALRRINLGAKIMTDVIMTTTNPGEEQSLAIVKIKEAAMFASLGRMVSGGPKLLDPSMDVVPPSNLHKLPPPKVKTKPKPKRKRACRHPKKTRIEYTSGDTNVIKCTRCDKIIASKPLKS